MDTTRSSGTGAYRGLLFANDHGSPVQAETGYLFCLQSSILLYNLDLNLPECQIFLLVITHTR